MLRQDVYKETTGPWSICPFCETEQLLISSAFWRSFSLLESVS